MRTSFSALETYKLCPQKYKFEVIDRIPAKKSSAALFGTHIHGTLRFMFSRDPLFPTLDEVIAHYRENWPSDEKMPLAPEEKEIYLAEGERMIKNFYAKNAPWNFSVVDLESKFEVLIEDPRSRETHVLAGRIDRIDKIESGYEVIDYKTTRRMPSQSDVDRNLQMSIYALGLQKRWPHVQSDEIQLSLYYLKHGEKLTTKRTKEATEATAFEVLKTIAEIQKKLVTGERFEPVPGSYCDWCPYKPSCPAWKHLYRKNPLDPTRDKQEAGIKNQEEIDEALKEYFSILKEKERDEARLAELKSKIRLYMEAAGYDRVFGEDGYLSRSEQKRYRYDLEKVRSILEPLGKWEIILAADERKLKLLLKELPLEVQSKIAEARVIVSEFTVMSASTKKIKPPLETADETSVLDPAS